MTPVRNQCEKKVNLTGPAEFVEFASSVENVVAVTVPLINTNRNVKDESEVLENISNNEEIETRVFKKKPNKSFDICLCLNAQFWG